MGTKNDLEYSAGSKSSSADEKNEKHELGVAAPSYVEDDGLYVGPDNTEWENLGFWTRNGLTAKSFTRRKGPVGNLNTTMKPRHLHMIAIGGSIGAGLFVGSGSALSNGVSNVRVALLLPWQLTAFRDLLHFCLPSELSAS